MPALPQHGVEFQYLDTRFKDDAFRTVLFVDDPDCSVEEGLAYWESLGLER